MVFTFMINSGESAERTMGMTEHSRPRWADMVEEDEGHYSDGAAWKRGPSLKMQSVLDQLLVSTSSTASHRQHPCERDADIAVQRLNRPAWRGPSTLSSASTTSSTKPSPMQSPGNFGSTDHGAGRCRPCVFSQREKECPAGDRCEFCHFRHSRKAVPRASKKHRHRVNNFLARVDATN